MSSPGYDEKIVERILANRMLSEEDRQKQLKQYLGSLRINETLQTLHIQGEKGSLTQRRGKHGRRNRNDYPDDEDSEDYRRYRPLRGKRSCMQECCAAMPHVNCWQFVACAIFIFLITAIFVGFFFMFYVYGLFGRAVEIYAATPPAGSGGSGSPPVTPIPPVFP